MQGGFLMRRTTAGFVFFVLAVLMFWGCAQTTTPTTTRTPSSTTTTTTTTTTAAPTFTVAFDSRGGSAVDSLIDVVSGSLISAPPAPTRNLYDFVGWFSDEAATIPWVFESDVVTGNMTLFAGWTHLGTAISTPQELADFVLNAGGLPQSGTFYLANDIDMSSISNLVGSTMVFSGIFDGQGYTIRNVVYTAGATKTGFLCKEVASGGVIQNVVFRDCQVTGIGESNAFIAAFAQAGASFLNLEFYNVSMVSPSTSSYTGLLFGDVPNAAADGVSTQITVRNITVINDAEHRIESGSYVGGLMGACRKAIIIDVENLYFDGIVKDSSQTAAAVFGRMNAAAVTINIRNTVIKGQITAATKNGGVLVGVTVSGGVVTADHVFLDDLILTSGSNKIGTLVGNLVSGSTATGTNIFYVSENVLFQYGLTAPFTPIVPNNAQAIPMASVTSEWFGESGFNSTFFRLDSGTLLRNEGEVGEVVETGFSVITTGVNKNILKGNALDLNGLIVEVNYSDGTSQTLDPSRYVVDTSGFDGSTVGTYTITVTYGEVTKSFEVHVIEIVSLLAEDLLMKNLILIGGTPDFTGLVVKAMLSDGSFLRLSASEYVIDLSGFQSGVAGTYALPVTYLTFTDTLTIYVAENDYLLSSGVIRFFVDDDYSGLEGSLLGGMNNFSSLKTALAYMEALGLDASVRKEFYIGNGTYREKITIQTPNVAFLGESRNGVIITYGAASGLLMPGGAPWGTQGSATVSIKSSAVGFSARNITFANDFDYLGATIGDKQAVALVNEADKAIYYQCRFLGWQDTLYAKSGRQYYWDCRIEGCVDFIFGNGGPAFFQDCQIHIVDRLSSSFDCITAQKGYNTAGAILTYGYVFYQSTFTADAGVGAGTVDLGRPWDQYAAVSYIDNAFGPHISVRGWTEMSGIQPTNPNVRFREYQNRYAGEIYNNGIDDDLNGGIDDYWPVSTNGVALSEAEAALASNKAVVFAQINNQVDFGSEWDYESSLTSLQAMTFPGQ